MSGQAGGAALVSVMLLLPHCRRHGALASNTAELSQAIPTLPRSPSVCTCIWKMAFQDRALLWGVVAESIRACSVVLWCLTLCDPMDCSPPGSSVHGILQARILERIAILFSRGSSRPRDQTSIISCIGRHVLYH